MLTLKSASLFRPFFYLLLLICASMSLAGCQKSDPLISGKATPPMWEAVRGETRYIIIGSVHELPPELDWQDARVHQAIADSDGLILELAPSESAKAAEVFARTSSNDPVQPLRQRLAAPDYQRVKDGLDGAGVAESDANRMESWALMLMLSSQTSNAMGLSAENGVERVLTAAFNKAKKPITGLETAAHQLSIFDQLPPATQNRMLAKSVEDKEQRRTKAADLLRAWTKGDMDAIATYVTKEFAETPELAGPLGANRNRAWAEILGADDVPAGTRLIAVGTGHLTGETALPTLLASKGFVVRRIT